MYSTYVLRSESCGQLYIGSTADLQQRLQQHNNNLATATKNRGPWRLIYHEDHATRRAAMARERYFKTGKGREELRHLAVGKNPQGPFAQW